MVKYLLIMLFSLFLSRNTALPDGPNIKFDKMIFDFGTIHEGDVKNCTFRFTNTGNAPLLIIDVEKPCGCTIPSWTKSPVMPGQSGQIDVIYNSKERPGVFRKTLSVKTNIAAFKDNPPILMIKGNALTPKEVKALNKMNKENAKK
jgi:hypothetical protein